LRFNLLPKIEFTTTTNNDVSHNGMRKFFPRTYGSLYKKCLYALVRVMVV